MKKSTIYYSLAGLALGIAIVMAVFSSPFETNVNNTNTAGDFITVKTLIQADEIKRTYDQTVPASTTAFEALQQLADEGTISIETTEYDFGTLVDVIDGVGSDMSENKYWIFYINGSVAEVGASDYQLQHGDEILWNYEDAK